MSRPIYAVLLAGRIRPSTFSESLGVPIVCLPVCARGSLLSVWADALATLPNLSRIQVVVNTAEEVHAVESIAQRSGSLTRAERLQVIAEPAAWRGAAGIVRDVCADVPDNALVLVCEAKRLPPTSLNPMVRAMHSHANTCGVVGMCGHDEPAGVYFFRQNAMAAIPSVGYFDLKEQLIPTLRKQGELIVPARIGETTWRIHDRESYLAAVRAALMQRNGSSVYVSENASVSPSALLEGVCLIEAGAVVEDGALVHDSVVLWGATIGQRSIVSRSVIGSLTSLDHNSRAVGEVAAETKWEQGETMPAAIGSLVKSDL